MQKSRGNKNYKSSESSAKSVELVRLAGNIRQWGLLRADRISVFGSTQQFFFAVHRVLFSFNDLSLKTTLFFNLFNFWREGTRRCEIIAPRGLNLNEGVESLRQLYKNFRVPLFSSSHAADRFWHTFIFSLRELTFEKSREAEFS